VFTAGDLQPGAGWGLVDHLGEPKSGFHGFRQVAQPLALGLTDEGCDGLDLHLLNDGPEPVALDVQVQVLRHGHTEVASGRAPVVVPAHGGCTHPLQSLLGGFLDLAYAFRFGPPGHDTVVVTAHPAQGEPLQACHFPLGPWTEPAVLGLQARVLHEGPGWWLELATGSTARFVHIDDRHHRPADNHFHLPPGPARRVRLWPRGTAHPTAVPEGVVTALNAHDTVAYRGTAA
jgi:beta-mannosidase